jgi:hypothetical protein
MDCISFIIKHMWMYCQTHIQRYLFYSCPTHVVFAVASVWNCGENWHIYFRLNDTHGAAKLGHTSLATSINLFIILRNLTGEQDKVLKNYSGEAYRQCAYFIGVAMPDYAAFDKVVRSRGAPVATAKSATITLQEFL